MENKLTLQDLKNVHIKSDLEKIAEDIYRYQKFNSKAALKYLGGIFSDGTKNNYFQAGRKYLLSGIKTNGIAPKLFVYLDKVIKAAPEIIAPSPEEVSKIKPGFSKNADLNISKLPIITKPLTQKFEYGVRLGNTIKIFEDDKEANLFMSGVTFAGKSAKVVEVICNEVV